MDPGFEILLDDESIIAVNKSGGLLTQAPLGIDSLEFRLKRMLQERGAAAREIYLGVPHRIDRPASGVLVFAKTLKAAQKLSLQFERRFVEKTYWGLVEGLVEPAEGTWTDQLQKIPGVPRSLVVEQAEPLGKTAILHYRVVRQLPVGPIGSMGPDLTAEQQSGPAVGTYRTLLEIKLETGRTHQIRVQCASRGHVLVGDELYGSRERFGPWSDDERERLIALHARSIRFRHPKTREDITVTAPLPEYWEVEL
jgi:23S rRNA pseudouridine1911/1915/1917 synthase